MACGLEKFDPAELVGKTCYGGLDLSNISDITALVLAFPMEDGSLRVVPHFWLPKDGRAGPPGERPHPLPRLGCRGLVHLTEGDIIDYDFVKATILENLQRYKIKSLLCDPYNATQIIIQLGAEGLPVVPMRQGFLSMNAPCKELLRLVAAGDLHHNGDPVLAWMADVALRGHRPEREHQDLPETLPGQG